MGIGTAITVAAIATLAVTATRIRWRRPSPLTRSGYGMLALRGIETAAAFVVLLSGCAARRLSWRASGCRFADRALPSHTKRGVKPSPFASMWQICGAPKCCGISSAPDPAHVSSVIRRERRAAG